MTKLADMDFNSIQDEQGNELLCRLHYLKANMSFLQAQTYVGKHTHHLFPP